MTHPYESLCIYEISSSSFLERMLLVLPPRERSLSVSWLHFCTASSSPAVSPLSVAASSSLPPLHFLVVAASYSPVEVSESSSFCGSCSALFCIVYCFVFLFAPLLLVLCFVYCWASCSMILCLFRAYFVKRSYELAIRMAFFFIKKTFFHMNCQSIWLYIKKNIFYFIFKKVFY